jgi:uncharacterized protein YoaH (UPF0181 family)
MKEEARKIQDYLDITVSTDPAEIVNRIGNLMAYMSRSGEMYATAKQVLRAKKTNEIRLLK